MGNLKLIKIPRTLYKNLSQKISNLSQQRILNLNLRISNLSLRQCAENVFMKKYTESLTKSRSAMWTALGHTEMLPDFG